MNSKKIYGLVCWALAFAFTIHSGFLNTENLDYNAGGNITGLIYFVSTVTLFFAGYAFYDSGSSAKGSEEHGH